MLNKQEDTALIIFVKNPEKGKVKTRLAKTVGDEQALKIYIALLKHTRNIALSINLSRHLFYSQQIEEKDMWSPDLFHKYLQEGDDLGAKMSNAFKQVLKHHSKALIIGSDCASLAPEIIVEALEALDRHPFVIGPAMDGGYYLLGMTEFSPSLFENMKWSTDTVCATTLTKIKALNKTCHQVPTLSDIDYQEDWEKYGWDV